MKHSITLKTVYFIILIVLVLGFSGIVHATPSADALYWEYDLGGGSWKYDYILYNTSDPLVYAGYDIYDFFLHFDSTVTLTNILSPSNWDFISNETPPASGNYYDFIDWFSTLAGEPPLGADIAPGTSLNGYSFISNMHLASLPYDVYFANPIDTDKPVPYSGNTAPVPEPGTMLLLGSGFVVLGGHRYLRWARRQK